MDLTANLTDNVTSGLAAAGDPPFGVEPNFYLGLLVAAGIGALVGLEREHHRDKVVIAGVRTFPLFSVAGYLLGVLTVRTNEPWVLAAGVLVMGAVAVSFMMVRHQLGSTGLTTPAAMVVTYVIGTMVAFGYVQEAVVVGVGVTFLLLTKERLHRFAHVVSDEEFLGALQFVAILFILFPLALEFDRISGVPFVGRGELIDPPKVLTLVLFVSGISFVSFLVMRQFGPSRGLEFSGLLGGLVNSEATATSLATHAQADRNLLRPAAAGVLLAVATMVLRNVAIAGFVDPTLAALQRMLPAAALMSIAALVAAMRSRPKGAPPAHQRLQVKNPFAVGPAVRFSLIFAAMAIVTTLAQQSLGAAGVYAVALGGFVYAGAATASLASLYAAGAIPLDVAGPALVIASVAGALNKLVVVRATNPELLARIRNPLLVVGAAGVVGLLVAMATSAIAGP